MNSAPGAGPKKKEKVENQQTQTWEAQNALPKRTLRVLYLMQFLLVDEIDS